MSKRHYWPTEYGSKHLVEHKDGRVVRGSIFKGFWYINGEEWTVEMLEERGWLGVRTPFSEEAERAAFEAEFPLPQGHDEMDLHVQFEQWRAWLAAKRHERGL